MFMMWCHCKSLQSSLQNYKDGINMLIFRYIQFLLLYEGTFPLICKQNSLVWNYILVFLQQYFAAGPSTGHQSGSQQSMTSPISQETQNTKKSLSGCGFCVRGGSSAHGVTEKSRWFPLLCSASSSSGGWLLLLLALLGILGPRTARRSTAASHLEPVYRLPPIYP